MKVLKAFSLIGLASSRAGKTGSYKAWTLARNLDSSGSGKVLISDLFGVIEEYKTVRTRQRWIAEAVNLGIFTMNRKGDYYRYISPARVGIIYGCPDLIKPIQVDIELFMADDWQNVEAELYAGYLEQRNNDRPVSRAVNYILSGVSPQTQWELEKRTKKIKVIENLIPIEDVKDKVEAVKKIKSLPDRKGIKIKHGKIVKQIPNNYVTNSVKVCRKGSTGKYRQVLRDSLSNNVQSVETKVRLYYAKKNPAEAASRKHGQTKYYHVYHDDRGFNWWGEALPC